MQPRAIFTLHHDGEASPRQVQLGPGDIIGRLPSAALQVADPRVSEAHAMLSLRAGELVLLALRRRFAIGGEPRAQVVLEPGLELELAEGVALHCVAVHLPDTVLAVRAAGLPDLPLPPVATLLPGPPPRVLAAPKRGGAVVWSEAERFLLQQAGEPARPVADGDRVTVDGVVFTFFALPVSQLMATETASLDTHPAMTLELFYDVVHIHQAGQPRVTLRGVGARLLSELALLGQPVSWETVAGELWDASTDRSLLRGRWDMAVGRLRHRLRDAGLPPHLLYTDGSGNIELRLRPADVIEDRT
ncbi:MAG: helix-turn-helix domain-containing protein [Deltaproteobacteria bacterium]|nr:MAG: helix-turn-helix domain-containing protein [Deltaproteobacteria bacterium]